MTKLKAALAYRLPVPFFNFPVASLLFLLPGGAVAAHAFTRDFKTAVIAFVAAFALSVGWSLDRELP